MKVLYEIVYYKEENGTWTQITTHTNTDINIDEFCKILRAKYLWKVNYYPRISRKNNYDGTETYTVYQDNGIKREFVVEDTF